MPLRRISYLILLLLFLSVGGYFSYPYYRQYQIKKLAEEEIQPFLPEARAILNRDLAAQPDDPFLVKVIMKGQPNLQIPVINQTFQKEESLNEDEIDVLKEYLIYYREILGARGASHFSLKFVLQSWSGRDLYVRFQQIIERNITPQNTYQVPVVGATIIAKIRARKLVKIDTHLVSPPDISNLSRNPGIHFDFTENEFGKFMAYFKKDKRAASELQAFLENIARRSNFKLDFKSFINRRSAEQLATLNQFFGSLGIIGTSRILISAATTGQLSLVRYGSRWMFQYNRFLNQPMQFDIEIPSANNRQLSIRNLRHTFHKISEIRAFDSPYYPDEDGTENSEKTRKAIYRMQQITKYYWDNYGFVGYKGKLQSDPIDVYTQLKSSDFAGNAAWIGDIQKFVVGQDGPNTFQLDNSLSVLGHEYGHAIVQFSSGLIYQGQAGAINEHFADLQGATISAMMENNGMYDYTVGSDILRPELKKEKEKLLSLILPAEHYTPKEIGSFNLRRISLRHLFSPALSYATQYDKMLEISEIYPEDCEPSVDNDNCGVHSISGIPNKASSLIISILGLKETKELFFKTVTHRLSSNSNFSDYVEQLYEECKDNPTLVSRCDVILASFAAVGIKLPDYSVSPSTKQLSYKIPYRDKKNNLTTPMDVPLSPSLKLCGWVMAESMGNYQIFDDKLNSILASRNYGIKTMGNLLPISSLTCACVQGRITQGTDPDGNIKNIFATVSAINDNLDGCAKDPQISNKKPVSQKIPSIGLNVGERTYCGWVSVNSVSKNITIIDNRFDVAILVSGYRQLTRGYKSQLDGAQCGCIRGTIGQATNNRGIVFNYFQQVSDQGAVEKPDSACKGIEWK